MSIDYSFTIAVGFEFSDDQIQSICTKIPAKTHLENRYDAKTGRLLRQVEVTDVDEYFELKIGKEIFDEEEEDIGDFIARNIDCVVYQCANHVSGGPASYIFGPALVNNECEQIDYHITIYGDFEYHKLTSAKFINELARIEKKLTNLGLKVRKPVVKIYSLVS